MADKPVVSTSNAKKSSLLSKVSERSVKLSGRSLFVSSADDGAEDGAGDGEDIGGTCTRLIEPVNVSTP